MPEIVKIKTIVRQSINRMPEIVKIKTIVRQSINRHYISFNNSN